MRMPHLGALLILALTAAEPALAQDVQTIWSCKDKDGRTSVTNLKEDTAGKDCRVIQQQRVNVVPAQKAAPGAAKSPAGFPKESPSDRANAKSKQRDTLERELRQEETMLADARRKLAEQEAIRTGDEKNYAKVLDRLRPYQDAVEVHQKNVDALKRELGNLR
jgi:hypothetical protein